MRRLLCSLVAGAALALAVPATAAQAAIYRAPDPAGDVRTLTFDEATYDVDSQPTPAGTEPDATGLVVRHTRAALVVRLQLDALTRPQARQGVGALVTVRGSNGQRRAVQAFRQARPTKEPRTLATRLSGGKTVCRGAVTSSFDYPRDVITIRVPRRCLGTPERVKVAAYLLRVEDTESDGLEGLTYDELLRDGGDTIPPIPGPAKFTPWVKAG